MAIIYNCPFLYDLMSECFFGKKATPGLDSWINIDDEEVRAIESNLGSDPAAVSGRTDEAFRFF